MKRIIAIVCILPLLFSVASASSPGFSDVTPSSWYFKSVQYAADNSIVSGRGSGVFDPGGTLSIAEAVKLAGGVYARKNSVPLPQPSGEPWYDTYFIYALEHSIISKAPDNFEKPVTRAQFASLIYSAVGDLTVKNNIANDTIRDIPAEGGYATAVYSLYRAGVLTGSDEFCRFFPERTLTRAEACEIIMRTLMPSARKHFVIPDELNSEQIFALCSGAVFSIETFDKNGKSIRTGSGFFISSTGAAATNLHVLQFAYSAKVTTPDGSVYDVLGVSAYNSETNVAIMQIDGTGFEWLPVTSSDDAKAGQVVYSIGNPLGLDGTVSRGIISYVGRESGGRVFIQNTASISQGSGGGALVDSKGYVIGLTSSSFLAGYSLNLATPSKHITSLVPGELIDLCDLIHADIY